MDRISESLLNEFCKEQGLVELPQDKQFEHFAAYITVRRHYSEAFDTDEVVTGAGGDTGVDAVAIVVNDSLVTDIDSFVELADAAGHLDVMFILVQAERSPNFEGAKIGTFGFGALDFFKETPSLKRNQAVADAAELMAAIFARSSKFKRGNPLCKLYYVTTGKWVGDNTLSVRQQQVVSDLTATGLFRNVEFVDVDAEGLQKLYRQTKNAISAEFIFEKRTVVPQITGVAQAYVGLLPVSEFFRIIEDDKGTMIGSLFYSNPRDWQDYNEVNQEIKATLVTCPPKISPVGM